jgi:hypothetical protein
MASLASALWVLSCGPTRISGHCGSGHFKDAWLACQAGDEGKLKRFDPHALLPLPTAAAMLVLAASLSGCAVAHLGNPFKSEDKAVMYPQAGDSANPQVSADSLLANAKADTGSDTSPAAGASAHCPQVVAWPQDRLVTVYEPGHVGDQLSIIHRGEITKLARDCQLTGTEMMVRYGVAGRVLLGPKGRPGTVTLPVEIRISNANHKVISTTQMRVTTTLVPGNPVGYFSLVKEVSFPIAIGTRPEDYQIFVALKRTQRGAS